MCSLGVCGSRLASKGDLQRIKVMLHNRDYIGLVGITHGLLDVRIIIRHNIVLYNKKERFIVKYIVDLKKNITSQEIIFFRTDN